MGGATRRYAPLMCETALFFRMESADLPIKASNASEAFFPVIFALGGERVTISVKIKDLLTRNIEYIQNPSQTALLSDPVTSMMDRSVKMTWKSRPQPSFKVNRPASDVLQWPRP